MRARNRRWDEIDNGNFERCLCGLEMAVRECLDPRPDKRPSATECYRFVEQQMRAKKDRDRAPSAELPVAALTRAASGVAEAVALSPGGATLPPQRTSGVPRIEELSERFDMTVWGTNEEGGTLHERVSAVVHQEQFAGDGDGRVTVESFTQTRGHEQVSLKYILTNVRAGGMEAVREAVLELGGVLECKFEESGALTGVSQ